MSQRHAPRHKGRNVGRHHAHPHAAAHAAHHATKVKRPRIPHSAHAGKYGKFYSNG